MSTCGFSFGVLQSFITVGRGKKKNQFEQIKGQTSPFSLDPDEPAQPEQEQPGARGSSDTQELLPTTHARARLSNQDPALP